MQDWFGPGMRQVVEPVRSGAVARHGSPLRATPCCGFSSWCEQSALAACLALLLALSACGKENGKEDKAKQAVREAVTKEFQYYEGAKQKLGEAGKQEQQRREQEKELN